jgi:hypothetical protein
MGNACSQGGLVVLGEQDVMSIQPTHLSAQVPLGVHRIQGQDTPRNVFAHQERLERADLIFFLLDVAMPQDDAGGDFITRQLMDRMGLGNRRPQAFAIQGQMPVISAVCLGL